MRKIYFQFYQTKDYYELDRDAMDFAKQYCAYLYRSRLNENGAILFHNNRYLNLGRVLKTNADRMGARIVRKSNCEVQPHTFYSSWLAMGWSAAWFRKLTEELRWGPGACGFTLPILNVRKSFTR